MRLLMLGDSLVEWGEWTTLLPELEIVNRGIAGETTAGLSLRIMDEMEAAGNVDHLLIMSGTNDLLGGDDCFPAMFQTMLPRIQHLVPNVPITVNSLLPMQVPGLGHEQIAEVNRKLKEIARQTQGVHFLDTHSFFLEHCQPALSAAFTQDGVHLSGYGYLVWATGIKQHLARFGT